MDANSNLTIDFVTIVFSQELDLLRLQARSMHQCVPPQMVGRIIVIINDIDEESLSEQVEALHADYGALTDKLFVCRPADLISTPANLWQRLERFYISTPNAPGRPARGGWRGNGGWRMQQSWKILAARQAVSDYVCILDAKNIIVRRMALSDFIDEQEKPRSYLVPPADNQLKWVRASFRLLKFAMPGGVGHLPPTVTPVVYRSGWLRDAAKALEQRLGLLDCYFAYRRNGASEFMLLFAIAESQPGGWSGQFGMGLAKPLTIFGSAAPDAVDACLDQALAGEAPVFSVHRKQFSCLNAGQIEKLFAIWAQAGVATDAQEAQAIMSRLIAKNQQG